MDITLSQLAIEFEAATDPEVKERLIIRLNQRQAQMRKADPGVTRYSWHRIKAPRYSTRYFQCQDCQCELNWHDPVWKTLYPVQRWLEHDNHHPDGQTCSTEKVDALLCHSCGQKEAKARGVGKGYNIARHVVCARCSRTAYYIQCKHYQPQRGRYCSSYCSANKDRPQITEPQRCEWCDDWFQAKRVTARFCSSNCRVANHRSV